MRYVVSALVLVLGVAGCNGSVEDNLTPTAAPEPTDAVTVAPVDTRSPEPEAETESEAEPTSQSSEESIAPDPEIMATMECEPLSEELLDRMRIHFGTPDRSVQVEVGEGLTPGEIWWVVILDSSADDSYEWEELRQFMTNAPGISADGRWIPLGLSDPWSTVSWDSERLVRGQSALTKARECLDG